MGMVWILLWIKRTDEGNQASRYYWILFSFSLVNEWISTHWVGRTRLVLLKKARPWPGGGGPVPSSTVDCCVGMGLRYV